MGEEGIFHCLLVLLSYAICRASEGGGSGAFRVIAAGSCYPETGLAYTVFRSILVIPLLS